VRRKHHLQVLERTIKTVYKSCGMNGTIEKVTSERVTPRQRDGVISATLEYNQHEFERRRRM
jgi:hypothetical protein